MTILQKIKEINLVCNNCNIPRFITDGVTGEIVCSSCGCVISENVIDRGAERRNFSDKSDNTRTGPVISLKMYDKGLNTIIGMSNQDSVGKPLSAKTAQTFDRLRKWDSRSQTKNSANRSLKNALQELDKVQSKLGLSDIVVERAALFFRRAVEKNLLRGRTVKGMAAACMYASCRDLGHIRTLTEIAKQFHIRRKDIASSYRSLFTEFGFVVTIANPIKSVSKIASKIGITERTIRKAVHILNAAQDAGIVAGKNPEVIAAAAIYAACITTNEIKSQTEISIAADISTVSLRNRILDFKTELGQFFSIN